MHWLRMIQFTKFTIEILLSSSSVIKKVSLLINEVLKLAIIMVACNNVQIILCVGVIINIFYFPFSLIYLFFCFVFWAWLVSNNHCSPFNMFWQVLHFFITCSKSRKGYNLVYSYKSTPVPAPCVLYGKEEFTI